MAGLVCGQEAARGEIVAQIQDLIGREGATAVQGLLKRANEPAQTIFATVVSIATLVVSAGIAAFGKWSKELFSGWEAFLNALNLSVSFAVAAVLLAMIYKLMPRVRIAWRDVLIGAATTALLFEVGKFLIGLYLGKTSVASGFGAAGSLVVLLVWVYYSAQIFLFGAELTWVYSHEYGSKAAQAGRESVPVVPSRSGAAVPAADVKNGLFRVSGSWRNAVMVMLAHPGASR